MRLAWPAYQEEQAFEGLVENADDHLNARGWYSEALMAFALRWKATQHGEAGHEAFMLDLDNPIQSALEASCHRISLQEPPGVVVNKDNLHWVAFVAMDTHIWLLDSQARPERYTFEAYRAYIATYHNAFAIRDLRVAA